MNNMKKIKFLITPLLFFIFIPFIYVLTCFNNIKDWQNFKIERLKDIGVVTIVVVIIMFLILLCEAVWARKKLISLTTSLNDYASGIGVNDNYLKNCSLKITEGSRGFNSFALR